MKTKNKIITSLLLLAVLGIIQTATTSNSGGAAGNTTNGCGVVGSCHGVQSNLTTISLTGIPASGYVPGQTYTLVATVSNTSKVAAGFDITSNIGTFTAIAGTTISGNDLTHSTPLTMTSGSASWAFPWTAPTNSATSATFVLAGNAINNNGQTSGDAWAKLPFTFASSQSFVLPGITNVSTTNITAIDAQANAVINANGSNTSCLIEVGLTTAYGNSANTNPNVVSGATNTNILYSFTNLQPNTTYHYRFKATNADTSVYSTDYTFTTSILSNIQSIDAIGIYCYPNPTSDYIVINGMPLAKISYQIFDAFGKKQFADSKKENDHLKINVANLKNGINYLILEIDGKYYHHTFLKQ